MTGGLGNQMFQYAMYKELKYLNKEVCMDDFTKYDGTETHSMCLTTAFPISYKKGTKDDYIRLMDASMNPFIRVKRKVFGRKWKYYQEEDAIRFDSKAFDYDDAYFIGYYQSEKYFSHVNNELRKEFRVPESLINDEVKDCLERIRNSNSVSLHIRRGDYTSEKFAPIYGNICTDEYYKAAIKHIEEHVDNPFFYVFTNDAEWVQKNFKLENSEIVTCSNADTSYLDMMLMGECKHNIIANSSFSWWGAWLNNNEDKIVISPSKWLNISDATDIYASYMNLRIDNNGEIVHV